MKKEKSFLISENDQFKTLTSENYNYIFNKKTGFFARWGKSKEEDPEWSPYGPEILDLEISTSPNCSGHCKFCYKKNSPGQEEYNMSFEDFVNIFHKISENKVLTQIAFGICDVDTNSDFFEMMKYAKENGVVPNYTCNGNKITPEIAKRTAELCGAVAVSLVNKEKSYDAVKLFCDAGMTQVNFHYMLSLETYERAFQIIDDISYDPRLSKLNAIVFLQYKHKNKEANYHSVIETDKYKKLMAYCQLKKVNYGFDSCSAPIFIESIKGSKNEAQMEMMCEPCESGLFSSYCNCKGIFYACSFSENEAEWKEGLNVLNCDNFVKDIWLSDKLAEWRRKLLKNNRECPIYDLKVKGK